ncbi:ATP-binding protein [Undibacterium sp. TS12]|uniref:ATP-binding protein n=1 Tax=Undibacterium sp. TS12 TaxID=2908202 RepID=UPI001F4D0F2A|nr:ATP-binding protein [Undibacterium sp. TS12]MCH8621754.1 ATP-binding protein [Undibacterium sp. TS12]
MRDYLNSLEWLRSGLFWRTFIMLAILVTTSMIAWLANFRTLETAPRAQQMAAQIISIVTITRAALTHSAPEKRQELLLDLANKEGVQIYLLEDSDQIEEPEPTAFFQESKPLMLRGLGYETRFASKLNGISGFWISFDIEGDRYWLRLEQDRLDPPIGQQLLSWAILTLFLTLLGAAIISKLINDPLSRLSNAARAVAKGKQPPPLPQKGPKEIRETNLSFNSMMEDLVRIESDRTIILAGISHDLRTPLARMQLEVEMANLSNEARIGMQSDLEQMDEIINQFLDYAKPLDKVEFERINISDVMQQVIDEAHRFQNLRLRTAIAPDIHVNGNLTELRRLFNNLIENACRYGKTAGAPITTLDVQCSRKTKERKHNILISFRDHGMGVAEQDLIRLLRPFTRGDASRSQANGSGLGLAIVDRIIKSHGGKLRIYNHQEGGFVIVIALQESKEA